MPPWIVCGAFCFLLSFSGFFFFFFICCRYHHRTEERFVCFVFAWQQQRFIEMATSIIASSSTSFAARASLVPTARVGSCSPSSFSSPVLGLPAMSNKGQLRRCRCSMEIKSSKGENGSGIATPAAASLAAAAAAAAAAAMWSPAAMALVDERLSTEGTGLPFGLSNNLLGWILIGVFALIWSLYFSYTATLEEDEESGLSL
ncbi:hypothetical protein Dimus_016850 [Dionaea muscipula]